MYIRYKYNVIMPSMHEYRHVCRSVYEFPAILWISEFRRNFLNKIAPSDSDGAFRFLYSFLLLVFCGFCIHFNYWRFNVLLVYWDHARDQCKVGQIQRFPVVYAAPAATQMNPQAQAATHLHMYR